MFLPSLQSLSDSRDMIMNFSGYNHNLIIDDTAWYDEKNMSSELYPVMTQRKKRAILRTFTKPHGLHEHNGKLCWVDGTDFYYDGNIKGTVADSDKQMITMGAYVLIFPDNKYYLTTDNTFGSLEQTKTFTSGTISWTPCTLDGSALSYTVQATAPTNPTDGQYWVDTSETPHVLKKWSAVSSMWVSVPTSYTKLSATGIGENFKRYDGINLKGMTDTHFRKENDDGTYEDNADFVVYERGTDFIVIISATETAGTQTATEEAPVTVSRKVPQMDFVTESENRIWGCSSEKHEIYACALGDPFNWNEYLGTSEDSYTLTVGSGGDFTGAVTHLGYVLFFKENVIHRLYGTKPTNYQLTNIHARGIKKNSGNSAVIVNETLFYHSNYDICGFSSSLPSNVSSQLGGEMYTNAVAGACGSKYYVCLKDSSNQYGLFVLDTEKGMWHKEDSIQAKFMASVGTDLYMVDGSNRLISVNGNTVSYAGQGAALEDDLEWFMESGKIGIETPDKKYMKKIQIRFEADKNADMKVYMQYDGGKWETKYIMPKGGYLRSTFTTTLPRRCDTCRMRIEGRGNVKIYSISRTTEAGSGR